MPWSDGLARALLHGPAELLPVSSSAHVALTGGAEGDDVELHAGTVAALLVGRRGEAAEVLRRLDARRVGMHALAGAIPAIAGAALERPRGRIAAGLLAGSALLLAADRRRGTRSRWDAGPVDGLWLGVAQAAALQPGVSRNAATLAVARLRGFAPAEANPLSREVGVPVTIGAVGLSAWRARRAPLSAGVAASFAATLLALPLLRLVDSGGPLWPWAAYRTGLALLLMRGSGA